MVKLFGILCETPPPLASILFDVPIRPLDRFVMSIIQNPDIQLDKQSRFFYSKLFLIAYLWYVVFRIPREMSHTLSIGLGMSFSILLIFNVAVVFHMFTQYGYECTLFIVLIMYLTYTAILAMIPFLASSPIGDALPEIKELPVSTRKPGINHCRRLAVCRATPVYDNFMFQRKKYEKCIKCAKQTPPEKIVYNSTKKGCSSQQRDVDAKHCYDCTSGNSPDLSKCKYTTSECEMINTAMEFIDPPQTTPNIVDEIDAKGRWNGESRFEVQRGGMMYPDRIKICKDAGATLCWLGKLTSSDMYRGWNYSPDQSSKYQTFTDNDERANGHGYPTQDVCQWHIAQQLNVPKNSVRCVKNKACKTDNDLLPRCACKQYKDVSQYNDPCAFLEPNCEESSLAYTEAQLRIKQADINTEDIINVDDVDQFINALDAVAKKLP